MGYYNRSINGIDEDVMMKYFESDLKKDDIVIIHAVAHNPTGADLSPTTMKKLYELIIERGAIALLDSAYLGFASGNFDEDRWAIDMGVDFAMNKKMQLAMVISFSKNLGMYGDRLGCGLICLESKDKAAAVDSQVNLIIRRIYSNPPKHPALIADKVLNDSKNFDQWQKELTDITKRINHMRSEIHRKLCLAIPQREWGHIIEQKGMFAYTGLGEKESDELVQNYDIFLTKDGRISIAGLLETNIDYVVESISKVLN